MKTQYTDVVAEAADDLGAVAVLELDHGEHAELERPAAQAGRQLADV